MGFDINVHLLHGFKLQLSIAFDLNLLNREIIYTDDYQMLNFNEQRDEIIERNIISPILKEILQSGTWNIYILTSSQDDSDPNTSYMFLYNKQQELAYGTPPDYETGLVEFNESLEIIEKCSESLQKIILADPHTWQYSLHWIVESSW